MNVQNDAFVDVYDVWYHPWWHSTWFYLAVSVFLCAVIFFVVYYLYKIGWFVRVVPYDRQALKDLDQMQAQKYSTQDQIRTAYFQLTTILKKYFAQRYGVPLHDKSDIEIVPILQSQLEPILQPVLTEFLQRSFCIKFAQADVVEIMLQDDIKFVKKIIEETRKDLDRAGNS